MPWRPEFCLIGISGSYRKSGACASLPEAAGHWQLPWPRADSRSQAARISRRLASICSGVEELPVAIAHSAPAARAKERTCRPTLAGHHAPGSTHPRGDSGRTAPRPPCRFWAGSVGPSHLLAILKGGGSAQRTTQPCFLEPGHRRPQAHDPLAVPLAGAFPDRRPPARPTGRGRTSPSDYPLAVHLAVGEASRRFRSFLAMLSLPFVQVTSRHSSPLAPSPPPDAAPFGWPAQVCSSPIQA